MEICLWLEAPGNVAQGVQKPESWNTKKACVLGEWRGSREGQVQTGLVNGEFY